MNPVQEASWLLRNSFESREIVELLGADFQVEIDPPVAFSITAYDDYDAHLRRSNHILGRLGKQQFQLFKGAECVGEVRASVKARFWWDFPEGAVQSQLKLLIGLRAVLPLVSLDLVTTCFVLRNKDEKIVAKGQLLESVAEEGNRQYLTLQEMRGYEKNFTKARRRLKSLCEQSVSDFGLGTILSEQTPLCDDGDPHQSFQLLPDVATEQAVRGMALDMITEASRHVEGVVADIDTVFLHRFRVSVRKMRSLVSLLKNALPPQTVEQVSPKLSVIAGRTSRLRDLDVFLLEKDSYRAMLPATHEDGLNALYTLVSKQRQLEKARVARYFKSRMFQGDFLACQEALSEAAAFETAMSQKPVLSAAKSLLIKRYKKIQSMNARLTHQSDDEDVHDIRKEFKKFRYLIEFFIELLPKKRTARLLSRLKKLQLTLGQFNDYCVQMEFLETFSDDSQIEMTKALSGLIAVLHHHQLESRIEVEAALAQFFTESMTLEIELAFGKKTNGVEQ